MNMMNNGMNMMNNNMNMMNNGMNMMNNGMNMMNMMNNNKNMIKLNGMNNNTMQLLQSKGLNQNNNFNNNQMNNNNKFEANLHKVGLKNLGQTCYMNSSLQCLANIDIFLEKLLIDLSKLNNQNTETFTKAFFILLYQLKTSKEKYLDPSNFKSSLGKFNSLFEGNNASDAKDLILFILQRLHLELKPIKNNSNGQMNFYQQEQISLDDNISFECFNNDFKSSKSCVSETFHGIYKIQLKCDGCQRIKYSYQTFNMLTFILKKIKDDKINSLGQYYNGINLYDAFDTDGKEEILKDENMIFCNSCQGSHTGSTKQSIYRLPPVLIIVLNRGKNNQDFNEEFNFPEVLDFNNDYKFVISNDNNYKRFFLCGIITHLGESSSSGHFICYCRNNLNDPFVCYNDTQIAEGIEIDAGMSCNISENSYEKKTPYILFYHYF